MRTGYSTRKGRSPAGAICLTIVAVGLAVGTLSAQSGQPLRDPCATGDPRQRIIACSQTILNAPANAKVRVGALVNRGRAHEALGELALALADYQAALAIDAVSAPALRSRAALLYRRGQNDEALEDLTQAIALAPDDVASLRIRGAVLAEMGDTARAIEDYSKVLDTNASDLAAREGRGLALASAGDHARAVQDFNRILERQPRARVARAARAFSLFQLRRYPLAIADWDQLLAADPAELSFVYCRGAAKVLSGDESGRADMESVRQQKPEVAAAQAAACGTLRESR
ncbi:MAG: tetratricopeptide repeat protein [Vicinamibacterales bacterium]